MTIVIGRREFVSALGSMAFAWPLAARAQQVKVLRIGVVSAINSWTASFWVAFYQRIPAALRRAKDRGCPVDLKDAIYFGARDTVVCSERRNWFVRARLRLFMLQPSSAELCGSRAAD